MNEKHIVVTNSDDIAIHFDPKGIEVRDQMIAVTKDITIITDKDTLAKCIRQSGILQGYIKEVEGAAKTVNTPFKNATATIKALEKESITPANEERDRLNRMASDYQKRENDRVQREENERLEKIRKEQAEVARLQKEESDRLAAIAAKQEKERQRLAALAAKAKSDEAKAAAEKARLELEASIKKQQEEEAESQRRIALEKSFEEPAPEPTPIAPVAKIAGATEKKVWKFEVTDLAALYAAHPKCVKLVEKRTEILDLILMTGGKTPIPGVRFEEDIQISTRGRMSVTALG